MSPKSLNDLRQEIDKIEKELREDIDNHYIDTLKYLNNLLSSMRESDSSPWREIWGPDGVIGRVRRYSIPRVELQTMYLNKLRNRSCE